MMIMWKIGEEGSQIWVEVYGRRVSEKLSKARMSVREGANVNDVFNVFKDVVMEVATEIIGLKDVGTAKSK